MNRPHARWRAAFAAVAVLALSASAPVAAAANTGGPHTPSSVVLGVQTYNMDFGADLQPLFGSQPGGRHRRGHRHLEGDGSQ